MKNNYKWPVTAKVVKENEIPVLKVNGETLPTLGFYGNVSFCGSCEAAMPFFETVSHSYENGNRLFIVAIETDLATKESKDMLDESARRILERAPDSYIIFRVSARVGADCESLPPVPEEDMQLRYGGGSNDWLSLGSKVWRQRVEIVYTDIINYIREQDYACRVIGFQIMNAKSGEWVFSNVDLDHSDDYSISERAAFREWLKAKYESNVALQTAWDDKDVTFENAEIPTPDERALTNGGYFHDIMKGSSKVVDWNLFYNEAYADGIIYCCNLVKHLTGGNVITGVMYGYLWSYICYPWPVSTGAFALTKVLKSGVCDSISSPTNYASRALGCGDNSMSLIDTMNLNNVLWTTEDDTRTFLTDPNNLMGDFPQNLTHTFDESISVLRRNFGYVTARGAGLYWMDLISA